MNRDLPRRKSVVWQGLRVLLAGSGNQAFLDADWVQLMLVATPRSHRRQVALRILGLSPHYFIKQWTTAYSAAASRSQVLCAEARRMRQTRHDLVEQLVLPYLEPEQVVVELGCGPGFMVAELASRVQRVIGVDISRGALACARVLHDAPNVTYLHSDGIGLDGVRSGSVDVVTSFAVIQHMDRVALPAVFSEVARVLAPTGRALLHVALAAEQESEPSGHGGALRDRYRLRLERHTVRDVHELARRAGLELIEEPLIGTRTTVEDDITRDRLFVFGVRPR